MDRRLFLAEVIGAIVCLPKLSFGEVASQINHDCLTKLPNGFWTTTVMTVDSVNKNNRIYPRHVVEQAIENFHRPRLGCLKMNHTTTVPLSDVSHEIKNLYFDGDKLKVEIKVLNSPCGKLLNSMLNDNLAITCRTSGSGEVKVETRDGKEIFVIQDGFKFTSIDITPLEDAA